MMVWQMKPFCRTTVRDSSYAGTRLSGSSGEIRTSIGFRPLDRSPLFVAYLTHLPTETPYALTAIGDGFRNRMEEGG